MTFHPTCGELAEPHRPSPEASGFPLVVSLPNLEAVLRPRAFGRRAARASPLRVLCDLCGESCGKALLLAARAASLCVPRDPCPPRLACVGRRVCGESCGKLLRLVARERGKPQGLRSTPPKSAKKTALARIGLAGYQPAVAGTRHDEKNIGMTGCATFQHPANRRRQGFLGLCTAVGTDDSKCPAGLATLGGYPFRANDLCATRGSCRHAESWRAGGQ